MAFNYNLDTEKRDFLIFGNGKPKYVMDGQGYFNKVNLITLEKLLEERFVDINDYYNDSPRILDFLDFMKKYHSESFFVHGFVRSSNRLYCDEPVSIEGIEGENIPLEIAEDFLKQFKNADELDYDKETGYVRCWYD